MMKFNPLAYSHILNIPARIEKSAWNEHVPFAHYLIEALRPRRLVELGTHTGVSYCSFCQAAKLSQIADYKSWAVDTWQGDLQAGYYGDAIFNDLQRHHRQYENCSTLIRGTFDSACELLADESFDVIHIDGLHTYDAVKHDYNQWSKRLADGGVVLFHDTQVRERDFGVYKFWAELSAQHPSFEFHHGHGLGVLVPKGEVPPGLDALFNSSEREKAAIRTYFASAGLHIEMITDFVLRERNHAVARLEPTSTRGALRLAVKMIISKIMDK